MHEHYFISVHVSPLLLAQGYASEIKIEQVYLQEALDHLRSLYQ